MTATDEELPGEEEEVLLHASPLTEQGARCLAERLADGQKPACGVPDIPHRPDGPLWLLGSTEPGEPDLVLCTGTCERMRAAGCARDPDIFF